MAFDPFGGAIRCKMYVVFMMETGIAKRSFEYRALYLLLSYCLRLFVVISFVVLLLWICFGYFFEKNIAVNGHYVIMYYDRYWRVDVTSHL